MTEKKSILCIVPLPPPITGAAAASKTLVDALKKNHLVTVISYQRGNLVSGKFSLKQMFKILAIGLKLKLMKKDYDSAYLVMSSSFLGNIRDIFLLIMIGRRLRRKTVLHLHGASIDSYQSSASLWIKFLNKKLLSGISSAIVLGETFKNIFNGYISDNNIRIVKNCFAPDLLVSEEMLLSKFDSIEKVKILFLSNLMEEKGYKLLLDAFLFLPENIKSKSELHFAGECYSPEEKKIFSNKIKGKSNIFYHGSVTGKEKRELLWNAHIFCLPTFYKYEGQPISILEAYAAGCIVITTSQGGINDIFTNNKNGLSLDEPYNTDLSRVIKGIRGDLEEKLKTIIPDIANYKHIAHFNREEAMSKYTMEGYCRNIEKILIGENARQTGKAGMIKISPYKIPVRRNRILALIIHYIIKACFSISQVLTLKYFKEKDALEINKIRKMLIIRTDGIGDVVMSTPAFKALRGIYPNAHIVLLAGRWSKELVEVMPSFDEVIYFDAPWVAKENKDLKEFIRMVKYLRSEKFDLVIDLRGDFRNIILMYMLNIKHRLGFNITGCDFLLTQIIPCSDNHHPVNLCLSLIDHFIPEDKQKYDLSLEVTEADRKFVEVFLDQNNIAYGKNEDLIVVIHPGAKWYGRRWKEASYAQIADSLIEKYNAKVILTGGPKDLDLIQNIKNIMKYVPVITPNNSSLRHFLALLGKSSLFIGVDSGPMHMAAAMNVKVVAILGPALSEAVGPYGKEHIVVTKQENYSCSPCSQTICKMPDNNCVEAVTVEEVWEAVEVQMGKISAQQTVNSRKGICSR